MPGGVGGVASRGVPLSRSIPQRVTLSETWYKRGFRNGPLGVKPPSDDVATVIVLPSVVGTRAATSCHQMGASEPI